MWQLIIPVLLALAAPLNAAATLRPIELHQTLLAPATPGEKVAALTLDACDGEFDLDLVEFLIERKIAATFFVTKRWLDRNHAGAALLTAHPDLFEVEDHGANHIPAVLGAGRRVYGVLGNPDVAHLQREVRDGAVAIEQSTALAPHWYRGATAEYDLAAMQIIRAMGFKIAGFSVNADAGASLRKAAVVARLKSVISGDVIIAHVNKPRSDSAEGLAVGLAFLLTQSFHFVKLDHADLRDVRDQRLASP